MASVGEFVWARRDQLPPLEVGEYYWEDLLGLRVEAEGGGVLGTVRNVISAGRNDVLVCGSEREELLVPFIEDFVLHVDLEQGVIVVRPMEGLD